MSPKPTKKKDPRVKVLTTHIVGTLEVIDYEFDGIVSKTGSSQKCFTLSDLAPASSRDKYGRWKVTIEFEELKKLKEKT